MRVCELVRKAQMVVDCDGNKKAVQLDYATWEDLLAFIAEKTGGRTAFELGRRDLQEALADFDARDVGVPYRLTREDLYAEAIEGTDALC